MIVTSKQGIRGKLIAYERLSTDGKQKKKPPIEDLAGVYVRIEGEGRTGFICRTDILNWADLKDVKEK